MPNRKNTLPKDLQPVPTYSSRNGEYELYGLMYSPSEKALYNSAFLKKKINVKGKSGFYTYQKGESGLDRKRVYVSVDRFLKQHPQYNDILDEISEKSNEDKYDKKIDESSDNSDDYGSTIPRHSLDSSSDKSDKSDDNSYSDYSDSKSNGRSPGVADDDKSDDKSEKSVSENELFNTLKNYK